MVLTIPWFPHSRGIQEFRKPGGSMLGDMEMLRGQVSGGRPGIRRWGQRGRPPQQPKQTSRPLEDFPGGLVVDSTLPTQGTQDWSLVGELGSHIPCSTAKIFLKSQRSWNSVEGSSTLTGRPCGISPVSRESSPGPPGAGLTGPSGDPHAERGLSRQEYGCFSCRPGTGHPANRGGRRMQSSLS